MAKPAREPRRRQRTAAKDAAAAPAVGLDLVDVGRFREVLARRGARFRERVFTTGEWSHASGRADRDAALAARFAVKEAVMKAIGTGWGKGVTWLDIEVAGGGRSAPRLILHGRAAAIIAERSLRIAISLSHAGNMAAAVAIATPV